MRVASDSRLPTGTVTFFFTDIEGSTRLLTALGDAFPPVLEAHTDIIRSAIVAHGGTEVGTEGDSFFAVFPTAMGAVAAAAGAQRALASHAWPANGDVRVRMGIHTGEGRLSGGNYVGLDVHRAARIAAAAHGGQVLISEATRGLVSPEVGEGLSMGDLGVHRLKDLPAPERLWQLEIDGLPREFPALRSLDARPNNLSMSPTPLIGREDELRAIAELLQHRRLLTLTGPGGAGKTRLALAAAQQLLADFTDGAFFVALEDAFDQPTVVSEIASALGVRESPERDLEASLKRFLRERGLLLVLDNFEQVITAAPFVAEVIAASPGLKVIVTSRAVLHLSGEQRLEVPPLALPDPRHLPPLAALSQYEAVALFIDRATAVRPDFEVTNENAPAVAEICARLDGLPLAIELAAARMKLLTPQSVLQRLERRLPVLAGGATDLPERQRTLRATVDWSYELLSHGERLLFERLAVFAGGWTLASAEEVCATGGGLDVLEGLASLADSSLIHVEDHGEDPRFSMLQVIREFAGERLDAGTDGEVIRRRHAQHMLALAEEAGPQLVSDQVRRWQHRLRLEEENLRTAFRWALDTGEAEIGMRTAAAIWRYWHYWSALREARRWLEALLQLPRAAGVRPARAKALSALAAVIYWLGQAKEADELYSEALSIYQELGDEQRVAETIEDSTWTAVGGGDPQIAVERSQDALARFSRLGDEGGKARVTAWLQTGAFLMGMGGTPEAAFAATRKVIEESRLRGDAWMAANWQGTLADIYRRVGDVPRAVEAFHETTRLYADMGYLGMMPWFKLLARLELEQGRPGRAVRLAAIAARAAEDLGGELPEEMTQAGNPLEDGRTLLSADEYERAVDEGRAMTFEEAVAFSLETEAREEPATAE